MKLVNAWYVHDCVPTADIPPDEDEVLYARRLIAQRCLYGVDKNPMAVDLSKLSLWLATLAKDHAFTFLDHSLCHGDSLVGLTADQISGFTWELKPSNKSRSRGVTITSEVQVRLERATDYRRKILDAREDAPYRDQEQRMALADEALSLPRLVGDACISAFFSEAKKKARDERCDQLFASLTDWLQSNDITKRKPIGDAAKSLRTGEHPVPPFHWEIEFPEVFGRENGGFDAFVGNPPFVGGRRIKSSLGVSLFDWVATVHPESSGNADLVAHFFRRAFNLLRTGGCFGLIATNTIGQGDTRSTGLRWICKHNGVIYAARRRSRWPGVAAVVVSVVHISKESGEITAACYAAPYQLDGRAVPTITAYLFHAGGHDDPIKLLANQGKSFQGSIVLGMGFTFDDSGTNELANPLSRMHDVLSSNTKNAERILPYIGGREVNDGPRHEHHRYVINFADFPLRRDGGLSSWSEADDPQRREWLREGIVPADYPDPVASDWPDLLAIVEERVKPERTRRKANGEYKLRSPLPQRWWQFADKRPALTESLETLDRTLAIAQTSDSLAFAFLNPKQVFAHTLIVFPIDSSGFFAVLQSRVHLAWAEFFAATMKDDSRYLPSDCFDTFPFPQDAGDVLSTTGDQYYQFRAGVMVHQNEGLTKTCNRFHDPHDTSPEIKKLRELHHDMDRAVLKAYELDDLAENATCEFLLDYEEEEDDDPTAKKSNKKKPWRYRWPDEFRDEVLARLLELNEERAKEEKLAGKTAEAKAKSDGAGKRRRRSSKKEQPGLF